MQIPEVFATLTNCGLVLDQIKPVVATPEQAAPDTLRGRFGRVVPDNIYNVAHGSDSVESAEREAAIWL